MPTQNASQKLKDIAQYLGQEENYLAYGIGYSTGGLGIFLFLHSYSSLFEDDELEDKAQRMLHQILEQALTQPVAYLRDAAEFGLLVLRLFEEGYLPAEADFIPAKIDALLYAQLGPQLRQHNFDQFTGYLTIARYFLERGPQVAVASAGLRAIIDSLLASCHVAPQGRYWRSQFRAQDAVYFGWSHGLAGVLLFLAKYIQRKATYRLAEVEAALADGIRFVQHSACQLPHSIYPDTLGEASPAGSLNLSYGDIGIVYALWQAAGAVGATAAREQATAQLLQLAGRRGADACHVYDASVLYGASGNMLFFSNLFVITQQPAFRVAAEYWQEQAQRLSQHPGGVAGYQNYYNKSLARTYPSFFEGLAGYGLAQLEYEAGDLGLLDLIGY